MDALNLSQGGELFCDSHLKKKKRKKKLNGCGYQYAHLLGVIAFFSLVVQREEQFCYKNK